MGWKDTKDHPKPWAGTPSLDQVTPIPIQPGTEFFQEYPSKCFFGNTEGNTCSGYLPRLYHMSLISNPICLLMSPYLEKENKTSIKTKAIYKQINLISKSDSQLSKREETPEQVLKLLRLPGCPHQLSNASANNKNWGKKVSSLRNSNISWSQAEVEPTHPTAGAPTPPMSHQGHSPLPSLCTGKL